jgi:hypothetical protein
MSKTWWKLQFPLWWVVHCPEIMEGKPVCTNSICASTSSRRIVSVRASLTEPVNPAETELFRWIYGFGLNRAQNRARKHGPARKRSLGARETPRTPRIKRVHGGEFDSQTLLPFAIPLPPPLPLASSDEQSSSPQPPIRSPPPRDGVPWRLRWPCRGIGRRRLAATSAPVFRTDAERRKWNKSEGARKRSARRWTNWGLTPPEKLARYGNAGEGSSSGQSSRARASSLTPTTREDLRRQRRRRLPPTSYATTGTAARHRSL